MNDRTIEIARYFHKRLKEEIKNNPDNVKEMLQGITTSIEKEIEEHKVKEKKRKEEELKVEKEKKKIQEEIEERKLENKKRIEFIVKMLEKDININKINLKEINELHNILREKIYYARTYKLNEIDEKLFNAISREDSKAVFEAIKEGANVNALNKYGKTPLMEAIDLYNKWCYEGDIQIVEILVNSEVDINYRTVHWGSAINYLRDRGPITIRRIHRDTKDARYRMYKLLKEHGGVDGLKGIMNCDYLTFIE